MRTDGQHDFNDNKCKLQPETSSQYSMLSVFDAQSLEFPANENGADNLDSVHVSLRVYTTCQCNPYISGTMQNMSVHIHDSYVRNMSQSHLHEHHQHSVMDVWMTVSVKNAQENQTSGTDNCKYD